MLTARVKQAPSSITDVLPYPRKCCNRIIQIAREDVYQQQVLDEAAATAALKKRE
jgi:hypothetical protein